MKIPELHDYPDLKYRGLSDDHRGPLSFEYYMKVDVDRVNKVVAGAQREVEEFFKRRKKNRKKPKKCDFY